MLEYPLLLLFPIAMVYAAVSDFMTMTIPNRISLALLAGFFAFAILTGMSFEDFGFHLLTGLAVLAVSIFMFWMGWLGGGDAKLLTAAALWLGHEMLFEYILIVTLLGGALALAILLYRQTIPPMWISGMAWAERLHDKKCGIPYGVALAGAGLWLYPHSQLFLSVAG